MRRMLLVLSVSALTVVALLVSVPFAAATPNSAKEQCKNGGFAKYGFANQGECIKFVNQGGTLVEPTPPPPPNCYLNSEGGLSCRIGGGLFDCERDPITGQPVNCVQILV